MKAYRNNGASHTMIDGTVIARNEIIKCEENLAKAFPMKFKEVTGVQEVTKPKGKLPPSGKAKDSEKPPTKPKSGEMIDVSDKFTIPEGYTVKRDSRGCWVYDGDKEPANDKPLKRDEVEAFIKECAE